MPAKSPRRPAKSASPAVKSTKSTKPSGSATKSTKPTKSSNKPTKPPLKVALVTDWLTNVGGAERVLKSIHDLYPDAPIYTSQYNPRGIDWFTDADVRTGWMRIFPSRLRRFLAPLRVLYFKHLDLSDYDLVISVTGAEAKGVKTGSATHICYCHVPTQYYWQMYDEYIENPGFGILDPIVRLGLKLLIKPLRRADRRAAERPDQFVTISTYAATQIKKYYNRESVIIAPPVAVEVFHPGSTPASTTPNKKVAQNPGNTKPTPTSHTSTKHKNCQAPASATASSTTPKPFITTARQVTWKRLDLAIKACLKVGQSLVLVGDGPEHARLVELARGSDLITFAPLTDQAGIKSHLAHARGYIFPSVEPFGIAPVESLAAGVPVIAFARGGSRDFITDGVNGVIFDRQSVQSLAAALQRFNQLQFDPETVVHSADRFSESSFQSSIQQLVQDCRK